MTTVRRAPGLPLPALLLGLVGSALVAIGLAGLFAPQHLDFAPVVRETPVASALVASGAVFLVLEAVVVLGWARRRRGEAPRSRAAGQGR